MTNIASTYGRLATKIYSHWAAKATGQRMNPEYLRGRLIEIRNYLETYKDAPRPRLAITPQTLQGQSRYVANPLELKPLYTIIAMMAQYGKHVAVWDKTVAAYLAKAQAATVQAAKLYTQLVKDVEVHNAELSKARRWADAQARKVRMEGKEPDYFKLAAQAEEKFVRNKGVSARESEKIIDEIMNLFDLAYDNAKLSVSIFPSHVKGEGRPSEIYLRGNASKKIARHYFELDPNLIEKAERIGYPSDHLLKMSDELAKATLNAFDQLNRNQKATALAIINYFSSGGDFVRVQTSNGKVLDIKYMRGRGLDYREYDPKTNLTKRWEGTAASRDIDVIDWVKRTNAKLYFSR